jgi:hypothetical protein
VILSDSLPPPRTVSGRQRRACLQQEEIEPLAQRVELVPGLPDRLAYFRVEVK